MPSTSRQPSPNIVLTGFMGVGKSAVGREVAARLQRTFIDMDETIEQQAGMSISDIFARHGEDVFRAMETALLRELTQRQGLVIATGGGTLIPAENRVMATRSSLVICLTAGMDTILERVQADESRPLLAGNNRSDRIKTLLAQRAAAYDEIPYQIDTTGRSIAEVADEVIALVERGIGGYLRLPVSVPGASTGYDILLGSGLLQHAPPLMRERGLDGDVVIVSDRNVTSHWQASLLNAFRQTGVKTTWVTLPGGESHKTLDTIRELYTAFLDAELDRSGVVVAFGGGVIGDMAGFAAATYLRGIRFVQIPTTLLAMVDASVGGKTGVDLPQGKNLVGAFKQPEMVLIDPETLSSLPSEEFRNGLAEIIKHGIIADPELFAQLQSSGPGSLESLIARALRVKIGIVQRDPYEEGERAYLNLGHTFAHAIERVSHYAIPHGQAVALGLIAAGRLSASLNLCSPETAQRIEQVVERLGLPTTLVGYAPDAIIAAMRTDKKRKHGQIRFVLPRDIGKVDLFEDIPVENLKTAIASLIPD